MLTWRFSHDGEPGVERTFPENRLLAEPLERSFLELLPFRFSGHFLVTSPSVGRAVVGGSSCGFDLPDLAIASLASLALAPVGEQEGAPVTCADRLPVLSPSPAPAAPTKRTLEGSRGSCLPPWSPCSSPRSRSVRRGLLCGRSCPEAPPMRRSRHSPSPPSAQDPLSLRRLGDPSRRAPPEALCHCSASTLLPRLQRFLRAFIVPRIGREHASCPPSAPADLEGGVVQPYAEKLVEALLYRGGDQLLGGGVDRHVRHPRLALANLVASQALAYVRVEEVAENLRPVLVTEPH